MTLDETLRQLEALGNPKVRAQNAKGGAGDHQFGVSLGDIRVLAKKIRSLLLRLREEAALGTTASMLQLP